MVYAYRKKISLRYRSWQITKKSVKFRNNAKSIIIAFIFLFSTLFFIIPIENISAYGIAPSISNPLPSNGSTNQSLSPTLSITVDDPEGDKMNITWYSNSSGSWTTFGTNTSCSNGTYCQINSNFSSYDTTYWWNVTVYDGTTNTSVTYYFTTIGPNIIYVDDDADPGWYDATHVKTVQEGIDNASAGQTIFVYNGIYMENNILLGWALQDRTGCTLLAESQNAIIDADYEDTTIFIYADDSTVDGFNIKGGDDAGFWVNADNVTIKNCNITGCWRGIYSRDTLGYDATNLTIENNSIQNNDLEGVYFEDNPHDIEIINNYIAENGDDGITMWNTPHNILIFGNTFFNNTGEGAIWMADDANNITISENNFTDNNQYAIFMTGETPYDINIYLNNFINNINQVCDVGSNNFDNGTYGNYWDVYDESGEGAWDNDSDGIVDNPFVIDGNSQDNYPLINPWNGTPPSTPPTINAPIVSTNISTDVEETNATLHGFLNYDGGESCNVWFEWGKTTNYGNETTIQNKSTGEEFEVTINGTLLPPQQHTFRPTGDIVTEWGPGTGSGYMEVDDVIPDETGTYIGTYINGRKDVYSITPQAISRINNVTVYGRFITDFIGSRFCLLLYEISTGSYDYSPTTQLSTAGSWHTISYKWETNPFTELDWKDSDINDLGIGICADFCQFGSAVFCTQAYADISYRETDPLEPGMLYRFRAVANNSMHTNYSINDAFLTKPYEPSNLTAMIQGANQINLAWSKGNGSNNTYIVRKADSYPNNRIDGSIVYNSTGTSFNDTGVSASTTYYYSTWSYATWDSLYQWSDDFNSTNCTTNSSGGGSYSPPSTPPLLHDTEEEEEQTTRKNIVENLFNITLSEDFYTNDTNDDGINDTFIDPTGILNAEHFVSISGNVSFLISVNGDLNKIFIWDTEADTITSVTYNIGNITNVVKYVKGRNITVTVIVEKTNWTYIEVTDLYPENLDLIVKTSNGRIISLDMIWRKDNKIFVLDDPVTEYQFIYGYESKNFLFDVLLELVPISISLGENINALISLINVGEPGLVNGSVICNLYYGDEIIWSEREDVSVLGQKAYNKTISTEGLNSGVYTYEVVYSYGDDQIASAQVSFDINPTSSSVGILFWPSTPLSIALAAFITVILIILIIWFYKFKPKKLRSKNKLYHEHDNLELIRKKVDEKIKEMEEKKYGY